MERLMAKNLEYKDPMGPPVRIGVLQFQKEIAFSLIGEYNLLGEDGKNFGSVSGSDDVSVAKISNATPAHLIHRLLLTKEYSQDDALIRLDDWKNAHPELEPEIITLGYTFSGASVNTLEYRISSKGYADEKEAARVRDTLPHPEQIEIYTQRIRRPSGTVTLLLPGGRQFMAEDFFRLEPKDAKSSRVILQDVIVGVGFHWEHRENQKLRGALEIRVDNRGLLTAINELPLEAYLFSVNSSEMMSVMPEALLKAQTVAARNTLLATMGKHHFADDFHLCADDHCQCYRGSSRETPGSRRIVLETPGEVITHNNLICDARYSKICGGIMERFDSVWYGAPVPYMDSGFDGEPDSSDRAGYPASSKEAAEKWIRSSPDVYCNTTHGEIPQYLKYSTKYFRWRVRYTQADLQRLLSRWDKYNVGEVRKIVPLSRGDSGRIEYLKVIGSKKETVIGKQYEIRKVLSESFLYSSAFVIEEERNPGGALEAVTLIGAGWGHGVGLCQIGATVMALRAKSYGEILAHYYKNTGLVKLFRETVDMPELLRLSEQEDLRIGDRCFEFFNCYAVARCPIYKKQISLVSVKTPEGFRFHPPKVPKVNLETLNIDCEFLRFENQEAIPK